MYNKPKLVIFDMDGVLIDACEWHRVAFNEALKEVCNYEIPLGEHYKKYNGLPTKVKLGVLIKENLIRESDVEEIHRIKQIKTLEIIDEKSIYKPEKVELLNWLKENLIHVACFTNSIRKTAEEMLGQAGVLEPLEYLVTNQDVIKGKPDPEGYIKILNYFNCEPLDAIIIEDSPKGIKAATLSGANVFEVENATYITKETVERYINENFNSNGR